MTRDERLGLLYIAKNITFKNIDEKSVDAHIVHQRQVSEWLLIPANSLLETLESTPINEMALFGLQLMFFEMHGKFLQGKPAEGENGKKFKCAWRRFRAFCENIDPQAMSHDTTVDNVIWTHGRNGLFHALNISVALSIDYGGFLDKRLYGENPYLNQKLISPKNIQPLLCSYFDSYINELHDNIGSVMSKNFTTCYDAFITKPLEFFSDGKNWKPNSD